MAWQPLPLATKLGAAKSAHTSLERLINLYPEPNPDGAPYPFTLYGTPGLKSWASVGDGPIRGVYYLQPYLYVVSGQTLYALESSGASHEVGEILGSGNVWMTANRTHLGIATSKHAYAANLSAGVLDLPEQYFSGATYQDGFGIFPRKNTEQFYVTPVDNMTTIAALSFSSADRLGDNLVTCVSHNGELWLLGERSVEIWGLTGLSFPFSRQSGGSMSVGCRAPGSAVSIAGALIWLGNNGQVYRANGYSPESISPPWVNNEISKAESPESAWAWAYDQGGHIFYVLGFSDRTLCYDLTTGAWHLRESQAIDRWRVSVGANVFGKVIVGDYSTGDLYELDPDTYSDNGAEIRAEATLPPVGVVRGQRLSVGKIRMDMQTGVGLDGSGQGSDPMAMLDWSDDDGHSWSNVLTASIGKIGKYGIGAQWTRIGSFQQRAFRFAISDPVKREIQGIWADMELLG